MSKKERIEYLESEVTGLHAKVAELIERVGELEKKQASGIFIPYNQPAQRTPTNWTYKTCPNCGAGYYGTYHACWYVNPNGQWITFSNKPEVLK
jgi:hypothetical protein